MKYTADYSKERDRAMKIMDMSDEEVEALYVSTRSEENSRSLNPVRVNLFYETAKRLDLAASVQGGILEVEIDDERMMGQIVFTCLKYGMFVDKDDLSRAALLFALEHMTSVFFECKDNKLVIDIVADLAK